MVQITRQPSLSATLSKRVDEGAARAKSVVDAIAGRASDIVEGMDLDAAAVGANVRGAVAELRTGECQCPRQVEAAADRERLKSAAIAGIVIFVASAAVLLIARRIVARRSEQQRRLRAEQERPVADRPAVV